MQSIRNTITFVYFIILFTSVFAQQNRAELPIGVQYNLRPTPIELQALDLSEVAAQDSLNDLDKTMPWRYGITRDITIDLETQGEWTTLPSGGRICQIAIHSPDALNLSINFNDFYLPEGTRMQLYNESQSDYSKVYTSAENRTSKQLGSWFVSGEVIYIEYYQPFAVQDSVQLKIGSVIHGYRMGEVNRLVAETRGLNDSGDCNYDVNCPIGADFDGKKDLVKKAVALLNLGNGYLCSSVLVNNTKSDKTPYLLTANHCLDNGDPAFWSVRFNWMSPNPICGTGEESQDLLTNFTMSGAQVRANNVLSDFALVELYTAIPPSWDVAFAGWDNSDTPPTYAVGLHHPNGDIMKICRDDSGAVKRNADGTEVWLIGGTSVGTGNGWEIGTTESGSSGSPLFNQSGKIIGQLYAGASFCNGIENNHDYDIYGRFGVSWNAASQPEKNLKSWLDPDNLNVTSVETLQNLLNTPTFEQTGKLEIFPNPASTQIQVINNRYPHLRFELYNLLGQKLDSGNMYTTMNTLNVSALSNGVYLLHLIDEDSKADLTKKVVISK